MVLNGMLLSGSGLLLCVERGFEVPCAQRRNHIQISVQHLEQGVRLASHAVVQNTSLGTTAFIKVSSRKAQGAQEIDRTDDRDALVGFQFQQVTVAGDDEVSLTGDGAFENAVVSWIFADHIEGKSWGNDLSNFGYGLQRHNPPCFLLAETVT
jgi:hypothetical protein